MIWGPGSKREENKDDRDKGEKRHLLIQPTGEKCLLCARTVARRTLGKVEVEVISRLLGAGLSTPRAGAPKIGFSPPTPSIPK